MYEYAFGEPSYGYRVLGLSCVSVTGVWSWALELEYWKCCPVLELLDHCCDNMYALVSYVLEEEGGFHEVRGCW